MRTVMKKWASVIPNITRGCLKICRIWLILKSDKRNFRQRGIAFQGWTRCKTGHSEFWCWNASFETINRQPQLAGLSMNISSISWKFQLKSLIWQTIWARFKSTWIRLSMIWSILNPILTFWRKDSGNNRCVNIGPGVHPVRQSISRRVRRSGQCTKRSNQTVWKVRLHKIAWHDCAYFGKSRWKLVSQNWSKL